jgi:hypothetical protein
VVSDSLDTTILEADGFQETVPVLLDDIQHFVTYRIWKLAASEGCQRENVTLVIVYSVNEIQPWGVGGGAFPNKTMNRKYGSIKGRKNSDTDVTYVPEDCEV